MSRVQAVKRLKAHNAPHHNQHVSKIYEKVHQEPVKKSVLEALKENFRISQRVTYVHRMIYVGEHVYEAVRDHLKDSFEKVIKNVNDHYCDEKLTGFFFFHQKYFCHFIEGSEESLIKHLRLLVGNESINSQLGRMKLLIVYHHVNMRILDEWMTVTAKPPTLLEQLNMEADLEQTMDKVKYCVEKLYGIGNALRPIDILIVEDHPVTDETLDDFERPPVDKKTTNLYGKIVNPIYPYLPELSVLELLLTSNYTQDLRKYLEVYGSIPYVDSYEDLVWPVPCDFVPMNVFEQEFDYITDLTIEIPQ